MAQQGLVVADIRNDVAQIIGTIESAQAQAAALVQAWAKLGGAAFISGHDWTGNDIGEADLLAAISSLQTYFPDILGDHGTNLYKLKW